MSIVIPNQEFLFRSFPHPDNRNKEASPIYHVKRCDGKIVFSKSMFNDRNFEPSVDRSSLLKSPKDALFHPSNGLAQNLTGDIRSFSCENYQYDAIPDPTKDRPSHAKITSTPAFQANNKDKKRWRNLKELLAISAQKHGLVIEPDLSK